MAEIAIRRTRLFDIAQIAKIEKNTFPTPWSFDALFSDIFLSLQTVYYTAADGDTVVGYAGVWIVEDEAHITNVAVVPEYRRRGIAKDMLLRICSSAAKKGCDMISLEVRRSNGSAQSLYAKMGFIEEGVRRGYYTNPREDAIIMIKDISKQLF